MGQGGKLETSLMVRFGRHTVGIALFALLNPLIYYHDRPIWFWIGNWVFSIAFALALFGIYALFFTERAKSAWPKSFFTLAWVVVVLVTVGPYIDTFNKRTSVAISIDTPKLQAAQPVRVPPSTSETEAFVDSLLAAPKPQQDSDYWTEETLGSAENDPRLSLAPAGSRFCRLKDGNIVVLFPPGVRPKSKRTSADCLVQSVDSLEKLSLNFEEGARAL